MVLFKYVFFLITLVPFVGCEIPKVGTLSYSIPSNLESLVVNLSLDPKFKADIGGSYNVKTYGTVEVSPSTESSPLKVGFVLDLDVLYDNEYVDLDPTTKLPNGQPIPNLVDRALVQVKLNNVGNSKFDVYLYVDVLKKEWLGVALTLESSISKYFPAGLALSQSYKSKGKTVASGSVFGPKQNSPQNKEAGIALFINVKALKNKRAPLDANELVFLNASKPKLRTL